MHWPFLILLFLASMQQPQSFRIGSIDFFGTVDIDVAKVRAALPVHVGDQFTGEQMPSVQDNLGRAVSKALGHKPTDINLVCCDASGSWMIFIGLGGSNTTRISMLPAPTGQACLAESTKQLYQEAMDANLRAIRAGNNSEDHSQGFALTSDPELRKKQLAIREYAVANVQTVMQAVQSCGKNEDRAAAAYILGYAVQSKEQIELFVRATRDPDEHVRNNAVRSLTVMASAKSKPVAEIPADPFIDMLNSGVWTDRNKSGWLLYLLSGKRDPALLQQLRTQAMTSLIEMARWKDPVHAEEYRLILGRIAGISDDKTRNLIDSGKVEEIIAAAQK